jgi:hypothetical protein
MSKKGLLKPEFNRVRTSTALKGNDMWENTIGIEAQTGTNTAIESAIYAPGGSSGPIFVSGGGGGGKGAAMRQSRQVAAANLISSSSLEHTVKDQSELMALAKKQGIGSDVRGACKLCGGLGHLTKQCRNHLTGHSVASGTDVIQRSGQPSGGELPQVLGLLPDLGDLSSDLSSSSSSGSEDSEERRERRKRKRREEKKEKKEKKSKKHKKDRKKEKSHKKIRREESL